MVSQNKKLFYLSGLFSISFFLIIIFSVILYSYNKDKILKVKTNKSTMKISIIDVEKSKIAKIIPKPKQKPKNIERKQVSKVEKVLKPVEPQQVKPPSFNSLFSKVDTSDFEDVEVKEERKAKVSDDMMSRLKSNISKTKTPINSEKDNNLTEKSYKFERSYSYNDESIQVDYKDMEITNSTFDDSDSGAYNKFYSQVKSFLYNNWYPSGNIAGNSAVVRIILNQSSVLEHYKIITRGKSEDFNFELTQYLESIKGTSVSVDIKERVSFEVKFRAKE